MTDHDELIRRAREQSAVVYNLIHALADALEAASLNERRFQYVLDDPAGARHLIGLLRDGKGDKAAFCSMIDRICQSKNAALASETRISDASFQSKLDALPS